VATLTTPRGDAFEARLVGADGKKIQRSTSHRRRGRGFHEAIEAPISQSHCRKQTGAAQSAGALHHLDPAAGSQPQSSALPAHTMRVAQRLYEGVDIGGETPSHYLYAYRRRCRSDRRPSPARQVIGEDYGNAYVPTRRGSIRQRPRTRRKPTKAIRPTDMSRRPASLRARLENDQAGSTS